MGGVMVVRALNIEDNVSKVVILIATRPIIQQRDVGKLNLMKKIVSTGCPRPYLARKNSLLEKLEINKTEIISPNREKRTKYLLRFKSPMFYMKFSRKFLWKIMEYFKFLDSFLIHNQIVFVKNT